MIKKYRALNRLKMSNFYFKSLKSNLNLQTLTCKNMLNYQALSIVIKLKVLLKNKKQRSLRSIYNKRKMSMIYCKSNRARSNSRIN